MQTAGGASEWKWRSKGRRKKKTGRIFFFLYSKGATEPLHFIGSSSRVGSGLCTSGGSLKAEANARARTEHRQSQRGSRKCHRRTGEKARNGPSAFHFIFLIDSKAIASQKRVNNHRRCQVKLGASHPRSSRLCRATEPSRKKKRLFFPFITRAARTQTFQPRRRRAAPAPAFSRNLRRYRQSRVFVIDISLGTSGKMDAASLRALTAAAVDDSAIRHTV